MKINYFQGELTDTSARKEPLVSTACSSALHSASHTLPMHRSGLPGTIFWLYCTTNVIVGSRHPRKRFISSWNLIHSLYRRRATDPDSALAAFTDDGFPLGMAYMLAVLQHEQQFDALHWCAFQSGWSHWGPRSTFKVTGIAVVLAENQNTLYEYRIANE